MATNGTQTPQEQHQDSVEWVNTTVQAFLAVGTVGAAFYYAIFQGHVDPTVVLAMANFVLGYYFAKTTGASSSRRQ